MIFVSINLLSIILTINSCSILILLHDLYYRWPVPNDAVLPFEWVHYSDSMDIEKCFMNCKIYVTLAL